jgi:hypothetical protein
MLGTGIAARIALTVMLAGGFAMAPVQAQPAAEAAILDADAAAALDKMGASLRTLKTFEVMSEARLEQSFESGLTLDYRQDTSFLVQMPDRMMVEITTDKAHRKVYYDGKQMTIVGLTAARYITVPMTGSISDVLTRAYNELGLDFPLQDLFRWGSPSAVAERPSEGFRVGDSMVRGQKVGHYAFRTSDVAFQIWMTEGDVRLPLRMVITQREEPKLRYSTELIWNLEPKVAANSFTFSPRPGDKPVDIEAVKAAAQ